MKRSLTILKLGGASRSLGGSGPKVANYCFGADGGTSRDCLGSYLAGPPPRLRSEDALFWLQQYKWWQGHTGTHTHAWTHTYKMETQPVDKVKSSSAFRETQSDVTLGGGGRTGEDRGGEAANHRAGRDTMEKSMSVIVQ